MDIDQLIADAQKVVDDLTALKAALPVSAPVAPEDVEIDVVLNDGTTKKFVPAPAAQ